MRRDVQDIFRQTPHEKQCMMFSATLSKEIRPVCKKFMQDVIIPCHWDKKSKKNSENSKYQELTQTSPLSGNTRNSEFQLVRPPYFWVEIW